MTGRPCIACAVLLAVAARAVASAPKKLELVRFGDGILGYRPTRVGERELLEHYAKQAAADAPLAEKARNVGAYLDLLLNLAPGLAERHMPMTYSVIDGRAPKYFILSGNWKWTGTDDRPGGLIHTSADGKPHRATGICRHIIPTDAVLVQHIYLDPGRPPSEISVGFTVPLFRYAGFRRRACRARWGGRPVRPQTDNTPFDYYAGPLPEAGRWAVLEVPAIDVGVGGMRRLFYDVTFRADGGEALWGPTLFRRAELELWRSKPLGIYHKGERVDLRAQINNATPSPQTYRLAYEIYDFDQNRVAARQQEVTLPASASKQIGLEIPPDANAVKSPYGPRHSYLVVHAALTREGRTTAARTAFGSIVPGRAGKRPGSPFGAMLWDRPASKLGAALYRDAGIKMISINPARVRDGQGPLLSQYAAHDVYVHSRIWDLAFVSARDARGYTGKHNPLVPRLTDRVRSLGPMGSRFISNFWEVDLRTLPQTYGLNAKYFADAVRRASPKAAVGTGGLAGRNIAWVDRMLADGGAGHIDYVQCMAYFTPSPPERSGLFEELRALRDVFQQRGTPQTQVWISEWSYFDHLNLERPELRPEWINSGVSRDVLSAYMVRQALICLAAGATRVLPNAPFQFCRRPLRQTYGHTMTGCSSHRHDYSPLPLYFAWSVMTRNLEGKACKGRIHCGPGVYCVRFDAVTDAWKRLGSSPCALVVWSEHGARPVSLAVGQQQVAVLDFVGSASRLRTLDGVVTIAATPRPCYLLSESPLDAVRVVPPVIEAVEAELEVTHGEPAQREVQLRVRNPSDRHLRLRLAFEGPNWCTCERKEAALPLAPGASRVATFRVHVRKENGDRVHYEFADLVPRAEHYLAFGLFEGQERVGAARVRLLVREPLGVTLRPLLEQRSDQEHPTLLVQIRNRSGVVKKGAVEVRTRAKLEISPASRRFVVPPREETTVAFGVRGAALPAKRVGEGAQRVRLADYDPKRGGYYYSFGIGEGYVVEAIVLCDDGDESRQSRGFAFLPAVRAARPLAIDGLEDDWAEAAWFDVRPAGRVNALPFFCNVHSHNKENVGMYFTGPSDLSARWAARWDAENLYLFFRVLDDTFHQPNTGDMLWNGDCVRLVIDPLPDETDAGIQPLACDPARLIALDVALSPRGPELWRRWQACGLSPGLVRSAKVAIRRRHDGLSYEVAIPWRELGPLRPRRGGWAQMSVVFNDSDGHGRKSWVNWFGGLGGPAREPRLLGDLHFVE